MSSNSSHKVTKTMPPISTSSLSFECINNPQQSQWRCSAVMELLAAENEMKSVPNSNPVKLEGTFGKQPHVDPDKIIVKLRSMCQWPNC